MKRILSLLLFLMPLLAIAAPDSFEREADYHLDMGFTTNSRNPQDPFYYTNGDVMIVRGAKKEATSSPEAVVKEIEYYIDGKKVGENSDAPFTLAYELKNWAKGKHKFLAKVKWTADYYKFESSFTWDLTIY